MLLYSSGENTLTMVGDHGGHKHICVASRVAVAVLRAVIIGILRAVIVAVLRAVTVAVLDVIVDVLRAAGAAAIGR